MRLYRHLFLVLLTTLYANTFAQQAKNDSVTVAIEPRYDKAGATHRFFFGESWRKIWAEPVKLRVFHLNKEKGGLKITQLGGGMQTKSVRMEDENGQEWVLRSIQKYPERVLPPTLRKTIAATILDDQIVTEHPFAALTVPMLASALGVPHANPEIVYVPDDPALGEYRKDFANQVFLFEEREPLDAKKTDNTAKAQDKLQEDNDNTVDQKIVLRARLLDMLLGDWDRHEDQWRWEKVKTDKGSIYKPVPRDRDQVFYNTSGVLPWLVSRHLLMAKFQSYEDHIRSINRWNLNARNFDRYFLNGLSEQDWREQIKVVQTALTDELINKAIRRMPPNVYQLSGPELINKLIARRNILEKQALKYYRFISSKVEIPGTDKHEYFDITNQQDGQVKVTITKINKDGQREQVLYDRTFDPKVTSELRLYGLGNEDIFAVHGKNTSRIKLRMVGGDDKDTFKVDSNISGKGNRYVYDRSDEKNKLPKGGTAHLRTSTDTAVNKFLRLNYQYDFFQPLFLGSYNKDYGVQAITKLVWQKHGFQKDPYAFRQSLLINYGLGVSSLLLSYEGEFKQVIKKNDVIINVTNKGPNYVSNFFGIGNNSVFVNEGHKKIRYYRNVYNLINADFRLRHTYGNWTVSAGLAAQYYNGDEEDNNGRFLNDYNTLHPDEKVFASEANAGLVAGVTLDTRDKNIIPHKGVLWTTSLMGMKALNTNAHNYGQIETDFSFLIDPWDNYKMVIANRTGVGTTLGTPSYYQLLKLGGNNNLRGFYNWRFTGKTMAFNNFEVRVKLFDYASYLLPGTVGVIAFDDVGRVWSPGERSNTWHTGYGGGLFFLPAQLILIQGVVGFSKDGAYPYISAGFRF